MFKILKNDEETPLDDLGFEFFNSTGIDDVLTQQSMERISKSTNTLF